ncbi:hypothetical protein CLOM_g20673 [Closterium sp. NIES-68]|nr:hypothetical protein CLOM_g20673 [Closterium sp. NIES-68]
MAGVRASWPALKPRAGRGRPCAGALKPQRQHDNATAARSPRQQDVAAMAARRSRHDSATRPPQLLDEVATAERRGRRGSVEGRHGGANVTGGERAGCGSMMTRRSRIFLL